MKNRTTFLAFFTCIIFTPVLIFPQNSYQTYENVVYKEINGRPLHIDLYTAETGNKPIPCVLFIHGGGWRGGDKSHFQRQAIHLAQHGYVTACIEYRLSGEAQFPAALEDAKSAIRWLRANAEKYNIDQSRIAVAGGSAGGHLAAMVALTSDNLYVSQDNKQYSNTVSAAVCFNPVLNLATLKEGDPPKMVIDFLGTTFAENPTLYEKASPINYVNENSPPFLIFHGTKDTTVPFKQAVEFKEALTKVNVMAKLVPEEGVKHAYFNQSPYFEETLKQMHQFLDHQLKK